MNDQLLDEIDVAFNKGHLNQYVLALHAEIARLTKELARAQQPHDATCFTRPKLEAADARLIAIAAEYRKAWCWSGNPSWLHSHRERTQQKDQRMARMATKANSTDSLTAGSDHVTPADSTRTQVSHTPLPWRLSMSGYSIKSNDDDMPIVANNPWGVRMREKDIPRWIENADFIVTACNAHPALVEALKALVEDCERVCDRVGAKYPATVKQAQAALTLAEATTDPPREQVEQKNDTR